MRKDKKYRIIKGARELRKNMTTAEKTLWIYLSNRGMVKEKFRRQHPISGFIVDFYCPAKRLAVEIDGSSHNNKKEYDQQRQTILEANNISFLRFTNAQIFNSLDSVLRQIKIAVSPSPQRGEGCSDVTSERGEDFG